jgi:hypothetical protein
LLSAQVVEWRNPSRRDIKVLVTDKALSEVCSQDQTSDLMIFMSEPITTPAELKKWLLIAFALGIPLYIFLALIGQSSPGFPAAIALCMVVLNVGMFWRSRSRVWFWITVAVLSLAHSLLIVLIHWPRSTMIGRALLPIGGLDFLIIFGCMKLSQRLFG